MTDPTGRLNPRGPTGRTRDRILEMRAKAAEDFESAIAILTGNLTDVITFYAASTSGGSPDILNTVQIQDGLIVAWSQSVPYTPSGAIFDGADASALVGAIL